MIVLRSIWLVLCVALPLFILASQLVGIRSAGFIALLQDASPVVLFLAWIGLGAALVVGLWTVAGLAAPAVVYHVFLLVKLVRPKKVPEWVGAAPTTTLAVANVYVDNDDFGPAAHQLLETDADVLVVVETTPDFRAAFDQAGGSTQYPFRIFDTDDSSDYAVSLYCSARPVSLEMTDIGELRAASARVDVGGIQLLVVGIIPMAAVDRGGYRIWKRQMRSLRHFASAEPGALVIAGDLNTTVHRAAFSELRGAGLDDAHDDLGLGLRPSFKLAARGVLAKLGPLVRLDHALTNRWVWATNVDDLDAAGSDHRPFVATLAVRSPSHKRHHTALARNVGGGAGRP